MMDIEQQLLSAFGQGEKCARKGGYLSDNPHAYESDSWQSWREGFAFVERDWPQDGIHDWLVGKV